MPASKADVDDDTPNQDAVVSWSVDPLDSLAGCLCVSALAAFLWYVAWTSITDGASILYWVGSLPALFGAFFGTLAFGP